VGALSAADLMTIADLNALPAADARRELLACCGSTRWASEMAAARPFHDVAAIKATADAIWARLAPADWLEAFAAHPRIGDRLSGGWAAREQAGVSEEARARFAELNRVYEARFGYIFIVCATGRSSEEMLATLEARLNNNPELELRVAAGEQRAITQLRLDKLLA
jgi:2-oxo-4-hydroxy-4-carboxy-5-ureidoimidazoline decarboxylase